MNCLKRILSLVLSAVLLCTCFPLTASAKDDTILGIGYVMTSKLRLYSKASTKSEVLDVSSVNECVVILSQKNDDWYKVSYNMQDGYMLADCLSVSEEANAELGLGKINAGVVYLRSGPGTEYSILSSGFKGNTFPVIGVYNGWYKILRDNATCYVRSDYFNLTEIPYENQDSETTPKFYRRGEVIGELTFEESEQVKAASTGGYYAPVSGAKILAEAQKYIGTPYVFGGTSPAGFDCSGLVYYVLAQLGYPAPRTAAAQYGMGRSVHWSELQPGDLVFFSNTYTSGISHVGIYAGGSSFLHAPNEGSSVSYSSLSGYWADHYHGARRLS